MYDFVVVGAGIAGLVTAELLQRSGRSVLLLEARDTICGQSSAEQQGWFHTGALYAALPSGTFFRQLVGNLDDLLNYYRCFPDMNLATGRHLVTRKHPGWFANRTSYYFYASPNDPSLHWWQRPLWRLAILRAQTRLSWFETIDFTRELSPQIHAFNVSLNLRRARSRRRFDFRPGRIGVVLKSRDRTFDSRWIARDLLNSFIGHGGDLKTGTVVERIEKGVVHDRNGCYRTWNTIVTASRAVGQLTNVPVSVVKSPLLVVSPALVDANFIWMTMNVGDTFNHLYHETDHGSYSLIGNATYFDPDRPLDEESIKNNLIDKAERMFSRKINRDCASLYFGHKVEMTKGYRTRNYQYHIVDDENCVVALPGKMSLAFSLAINLCRHFGIDPVAELSSFEDHGAQACISYPEHFRRFSELSVRLAAQ